MEFTLGLLAIGVMVLLAMNIRATSLVFRDAILSDRTYLPALLAVIWLFPLIGANLVFAFQRYIDRNPPKTDAFDAELDRALMADSEDGHRHHISGQDQ